MNRDIVTQYIQHHSLIGIKAGTERSSFLNIWMVVVNNRIFARSWGLAEKSWYNSFLQNPVGQIQCGESIFSIKATVPQDIETITEAINKAYVEKYNSPNNIEYTNVIIQEKHSNKTMEFMIDEA